MAKISIARILGSLFFGLLLSGFLAFAAAAYSPAVPAMMDAVVDQGYASDRAIFIGINASNMQTTVVLISVQMPLEEFLAAHDDVTLPSPSDLRDLGVPTWSAAMESSYGGWNVDEQMTTSWTAVLDRAYGVPLRSFRSRMILHMDKDSVVTPNISVESGFLTSVDEDSWLGLPGVIPTRPMVFPLICNWLICSVLGWLGLETIAVWRRRRSRRTKPL